MGDDGALRARPGIVWIASYPRSGNTWIRIVLNRLLLPRHEWQDDLDQLIGGDGHSGDRSLFDGVVGVDAAELDADVSDSLRPRVYETLARESTGTRLVKVHDAYRLTSSGEPLFPASATRCVIHAVRDPRDVAVSLAHFFAMTMDEAVNCICDPKQTIDGTPGRLDRQLPQRLFDWSGHATSWLSCPLPRLTVRFEDMLADPFTTFRRVARFAEIPSPTSHFIPTIEASEFSRLQNMEEKTPLREKPHSAGRFFRRGRSGSWRDALNTTQVIRIIEAHGDVMKSLGYLEERQGTGAS